MKKPLIQLRAIFYGLLFGVVAWAIIVFFSICWIWQ